jgi:hypothetical protein
MNEQIQEENDQPFPIYICEPHHHLVIFFSATATAAVKIVFR